MSEDDKTLWDRYANRIGLGFSFIAIVLSALSYSNASKSLEMSEKVHSDRYAGVEVSAVDPLASMAGIDNDALKNVAGQVRGMLETVVAEI